MSAYKEIVTKTIVGKGKKTFENTYTLNEEAYYEKRSQFIFLKLYRSKHIIYP